MAYTPETRPADRILSDLVHLVMTNRRLRLFLAVVLLVAAMQWLTPVLGGIGAMIGLGLFFVLMPPNRKDEPRAERAEQ